MKKQGMVSKVDGDKLEVILARSSACGDCSKCGGCETEIINLNLSNDIDAKIGDFVELNYDSSKMIKTTLLLYGFPLLMLAVGIYLGYSLDFGLKEDSRDLFSFALGIIFVAISYFIVHSIDKKSKDHQLVKIKKINSII